MTKAPRFAIVGGESLLGKELVEVFEALPLPLDLKLIGAAEADEDNDEEASAAPDPGSVFSLTESSGEAVVVSPLDEENLTSADVLLLAGSPRSAQLAWDMLALRKQRPFVIDLTGTLTNTPGAQLRAPSVETAPFEVRRDAVQVIAHPATVALAILLRKVREQMPKQIVANLLLPASEQDNPGVHELHRQTVSLFGFQNMPKKVFDEQLAFNLLANWGEEAKAGKLLAVEQRIHRELPRLLPKESLPAISLRVVQAPVFHSLSFSLWIDFAEATEPQSLADTLSGDLVDLWKPELGAPTNLSAVGEAGIVCGDLRTDASHPSAIWLWMVADNLRLRAVSALGAARIWLS